MSGRAATTDVIPGRLALSVGMPGRPAPPGWSWVSLDRVAIMATGHTPSRNHPEYWGGHIPWISVRDARPFHGGVIHTTAEFTNPLGIENSAAVILPPNTVCLSRTGSIGYSILLGREMATSQGFVNWICGPALEPAFLRDLFVAENSFLHSISEGVAHTTIYFPEARAFHICLPPINEQRRIIAKIEELFSDLDAGVAALERVKANLKRYRAAVLKAAVEGRLTEEWRTRHPTTEPAAKLLERILAERRAKWEQDHLRKFKEAGKTPPKVWKEKYSPPATRLDIGPFQVPTGWCLTSIAELGEVVTGSTPSTKRAEYFGGPIPFVKPTDLNVGYMVTSARDSLSEEGASVARLIPAHSVLVTCIGATIGKTGFVRVACATNQQINAIVVPWPESLRPWLFWVLCSQMGQEQIRDNASATTLPILNKSTFERLAIPLPPANEQAELVAEIDRRLSVADAAETQVEHALQRAARLRQAILKRAFEGKLVPQDPTAEPVAAILERIKAGASAASNGQRATIRSKGDRAVMPTNRRSRTRA